MNMLWSYENAISVANMRRDDDKHCRLCIWDVHDVQGTPEYVIKL